MNVFKEGLRLGKRPEGRLDIMKLIKGAKQGGGKMKTKDNQRQAGTDRQTDNQRLF